MTGYQSKKAAALDKLVVTDIDGHVVRDVRKPKKAAALNGYIKKIEDLIQERDTWKAAAQRPWVGLTDAEKSELWEISRAALPRYATYASLIEAKLKERNK